MNLSPERELSYWHEVSIRKFIKQVNIFLLLYRFDFNDMNIFQGNKNFNETIILILIYLHYIFIICYFRTSRN